MTALQTAFAADTDLRRQAHSAHSSLREKMIEHLFVGELLKYLWMRDIQDVVVLRPEVDTGGYDLLIECNGCARHIQFKSTLVDGAADHVSVSQKLAERPAGCVIWLLLEEKMFGLVGFLWFGGSPGEKLPVLGDKAARHSKPSTDLVKAVRPGHRIVSKARFRRLASIEDVAFALFGSAIGER